MNTSTTFSNNIFVEQAKVHKILQIKQLVNFATAPRVRLLKAVCEGGATPIAVREMQKMGLVQHYVDDKKNNTNDDEQKTTTQTAQNNNSSLTGCSLPRITPAGVGMILAHQMQVTFFDLCVLAKIYHCLVQLNKKPLPNILQQPWRQKWGEIAWESCINRPNKGLLPKDTLEFFFEDWPVYNDRIGHTVSKLRSKKMLPKSPYNMVSCNLKQWQHEHDKLVMLSEWVDERGELMRNIILDARQRYEKELERDKLEQIKIITTSNDNSSSSRNSTLDNITMSKITSKENNDGDDDGAKCNNSVMMLNNHTIDNFTTVQTTLVCNQE